MIFGLVALAVSNIIALSLANKFNDVYAKPSRIAISFIAPFQELAIKSVRAGRDVWLHYFYLVSVNQENDRLKNALRHTTEIQNRYLETTMNNSRLRELLKFQNRVENRFIAAEVIGKDPSPWFKSIMIDKGRAAGMVKGLPVVVAEGVIGQVIEVGGHYSKVLLLIDQNSAVDAMIQKSRARGVLKGNSTGQCKLYYMLRKHEIHIGDTVVTSGLDGVYPKGLRIGYVSAVTRQHSGIFQEISVNPFADFEKFEEVLVVLERPMFSPEPKSTLPP
jgi:rod shape-determining protein MreC